MQLTAEDAKHRRNEERWDNFQRRLIVYVVVGLIVGAYIFAASAALAVDDPDTKEWAQDIVTALAGALAGAIAGYFAGSRGD